MAVDLTELRLELTWLEVVTQEFTAEEAVRVHRYFFQWALDIDPTFQKRWIGRAA